MKEFCLRFFTIVLGLGLVFGGVPFTSAQESAADEFTLEEITVTAEKRVENLQKVSISVAVVKGEELMNQGATSITDILKDIPNVSTSDTGTGGGFMINIRGLGNDMPTGVGDSSVSTNFDGAYEGRSEAGLFGYFDVDQVEVLRGPQGTLYGRNSTGGVVNITSKKPKTDKVEGYVALEAGDYKKMKAEAAINVPVTDTFAGRLAFVSTKTDAYTHDSAGYRGSQDGIATRLQLRYMPSDDVFFNLLYSFTQRNGGLWSDVSKVNWDAGKYDLNESTYPYDTTRKDKNTSSKISLTAQFPLGIGVVTVIPTYEKMKGSSSNYGLSQGPPPQTVGFNQEFRPYNNVSEIFDLRYGNNSDSEVIWSFSLYWTKTDDPAAPGDTRSPDRWNNSKAVNGHITYPFTDTFRGVAGFRYDVDKKGFDNAPGGWLSPSNSFSYNYFDWKAGVEKDLAQDMMGYFTLATGHKVGGFSDMDGKPFDMESTISGELGLKSRFLENRLQVNANVFYFQYKGYQVVDQWSEVDTDGTGRDGWDNYVIFFNANKAQSYGAEMETTALLGDATALDFNFSYLKNEYIEDFYMHTVATAPAINMNGETMPHSPEFTFKAGIEHTFSFSDGSTLRPKLSYRWTDKQYYGTLPLAINLGPAYSIVDFTMTYTSTKSWSLNLYANNALNEHYYTSTVTHGPNLIYFPANPRTMGLTLNIKF